MTRNHVHRDHARREIAAALDTMVSRPCDYPLLRQRTDCPLCGKRKPTTALACWPCFNLHGVGKAFPDNNLWADRRFERAEAWLFSSQGAAR